MSVKVSAVTKVYGTQKALDQVSFEVSTPQVVGFLGPNGAGKSTMMKAITCFIPVSEGKITVCGFDATEQSLEVRRCVGYLPEHNPLYLDMYVKEYLLFIAGLHTIKGAEADKRVEEMIAMTGLGLERRKKIGTLSKGYRQRVGLAQALIHDPKVLILDEPTSGLDPNQLTEIRALIKEVGKEKTVILSTHIMQEVEAICDRVIIINKGQIVADDDTLLLRERMSSKTEIVEIEFDASCNSEELAKLKGVISTSLIGENKWRIEGKGNDDLRALLFQFAVKNGISVLTLQKQTQSLENIFHELTQTAQS